MDHEKRPLGIGVLEAAERRIAWAFDTCKRVYVSFSGGKDSTVMLHLTAEAARTRGRRFGVLFVDLEGQYKLTIDHVEACLSMYADCADPFWVALPIALRNAVSQFEPKWQCWDPGRRGDWIREPSSGSITDTARFPFFKINMEFEEFVPKFGDWYSGGELTACLVGIRADESLNRFRTIKMDKQCFEGRQWTTYVCGTVYNVYPIYDWRTEDVWTYHGRTGKPYNRLYDLMAKAGLSIHQQRICQPYGDDQRKGLWLFHLIEPETWARVVARVNGANQGALYARESGNILGRIKINKPPNHTWQSFAHLLLNSMPGPTREHFENKISVFIHWWQDRGFEHGIPDEVDSIEESGHKKPSWRRICKALLRNDYWCKGLSFTQHKSEAYDRYRKIMAQRKNKWALVW